MPETPKGPYIVWRNYGSEGWQPASAANLDEALELAMDGTAPSIITQAVVLTDLLRID